MLLESGFVVFKRLILVLFETEMSPVELNETLPYSAKDGVMGNNMVRPIQRIDPNEKVACCPECQYRDGFHVSLYTPDNETVSEVILICPSCHSHFALGWKVTVEASRPDS